MKLSHIVWAAACGLLLLVSPNANAQDAEPSPQKLFEQFDKNKDGKLTAEEVGKERARYFSRLLRIGDKNKDGKLSNEEFTAALNRREQPVTQPADGRGRGQQFDPGRLFGLWDRNKDGKLTLEEVPEQARGRFRQIFERLEKKELNREEFSSALRQTGGGNRGEFFKRLDRNNDGKLTLEEIPESLRPRYRQAFQRLGKDALTQEEFARINGGNQNRPTPEQLAQARRQAESQFDRADADGDGKVTLDEIPEANRPAFRQFLRGAGKKDDASFTKDEFVRIVTRNNASARGRNTGRRLSPEEQFKEIDADGDGKVSVAEVPNNRKGFVRELLRRSGKDIDGQLSKDEFVTEVNKFIAAFRERAARSNQPNSRRRPQQPPQDASRGPVIFRVLDTDRDGKISKDELAKAADKFAELDRNKDGSLDPEELFGPRPTDRRRGTRPNQPPRTDRPQGNNSQDFFRRIDKNSDGKISKDEAPEQMKANFARLDRNNDGSLDREELRSSFRGRPRQPRPESRPRRPQRPDGDK